VTDETPNPTAPEPDPDPAPTPTSSPSPGRRPSSADTRANRPEYKGAELDPERGPGLGCFWFQVIVLGFFIVLIPIGLNLNWPFELLAILLFVVIGLLLLTGQTVIFLLRLVAADRRAEGRRRPLASPTKTVGELEDQLRVAHAVGSARPVGAAPLAPAARRRAARAAASEAAEPEATGPVRAPEAMGADGAAVVSAGPPDGGAALTGDGAGDREGPPASPMHGSLPAGRRTRRARAGAANAPAAHTPDAPTRKSAPAEESAPADEGAPGEPPEEPDPGVRQ
jgi:hypothetical protein